MYFPRRKNKGLADSENAVREAQANLEAVKSREEEVHEIAESLRVMRERNHFAEKLGDIFFGDPHHHLGGGHAR